MNQCSGSGCYVDDIEEFGEPIIFAEEMRTKVDGHVVATETIQTFSFCSPQCLASYLTQDRRVETDDVTAQSKSR